MLGVVPGLVLVGVIKDQSLAFLPALDLLPNPHPKLILRLRHDQAQMKPKHAIVRTTMGRKVLAGFEDREHRRLQAGNSLHDAPGLRTEADVLL